MSTDAGGGILALPYGAAFGSRVGYLIAFIALMLALMPSSRTRCGDRPPAA
jgi:hypothetical protein